MELYAMLEPRPEYAYQKVKIRRESDKKVARVRFSQLKLYGDTGMYEARSKAAALRLENEEWTKEAK